MKLSKRINHPVLSSVHTASLSEEDWADLAEYGYSRKDVETIAEKLSKFGKVTVDDIAVWLIGVGNGNPNKVDAALVKVLDQVAKLLPKSLWISKIPTGKQMLKEVIAQSRLEGILSSIVRGNKMTKGGRDWGMGGDNKDNMYSLLGPAIYKVTL